MKKLTIIVIGILFVWFTLNMTGFAIGKFILVVSAFKGEYIDILWWFIFIIVFIIFVFKDKIGKYIMSLFLIIWAFIQGAIYFRDQDGIQSYYNYFNEEGTHRLILVNSSFLIKDTYHIFLDIFILFSLVCVIILIMKKLKNSTK